MHKAIAKIKFLSTAEGGRKSPLPLTVFGCPVFFENIAALSTHGYDCRLLVAEHGEVIIPGETVDELGMIFLCPEDVFPNLEVGACFTLWEGKVIAHGRVVWLE
jgi:hypothetical protein